MSKIKEFFQSLVMAGTIPQEPMNYDAETLKIYIDHLEAENAALRKNISENATLREWFEKEVEMIKKIDIETYKKIEIELKGE